MVNLMALVIPYHAFLWYRIISLKLLQQKLMRIINGFSYCNCVLVTHQCIFMVSVCRSGAAP